MKVMTIDVGNTYVHIGVFEGERLTMSRIVRTPDNPYGEAMVLGSVKAASRIDDAIVASVVPWLTPRLLNALALITEKKPVLLTSASDIGIEIHYKKEQIGPDRLANALYVKKHVGERSIVVDIGTAITIDAVEADGSFLGGVILPGPHTALQCLSEKAALLKEIELDREETYLGNDTASCLRIGLLRGFAHAIEGLVKGMIEELNWESPRLLITGGDSSLLSTYLSGFNYVKDLGLLGLKAALDTIRSGEHQGGR